MEGLVNHSITIFMGFFAIMNPLANTGIFLGLTSDDDAKTKKTIAFKSLSIAFLIILVCSVTGKLIFDLFGFTLPALRITGGVLVFFIGFNMLNGKNSEVHHPTDEDNKKSIEAKLSIAVSPLAIPILAGPGTIATAMNYSAYGGMTYVAITVAAFALLCFITFLFFISGEKLVKYIGESAIKVVGRVMGLILAIIGTQMFIDGIYGAIHAFK